MAKKQHALAREVLGLIREANQHKDLLNYKSVAISLGRAADEKKAVYQARAVAQACDLLDAAAALAHLPPLALIAVREASGDINRAAWGNVAVEERESIINRALCHDYTQQDIEAIEQSLDSLTMLGNMKAWAYVRENVPNQLLFYGDEPQEIPTVGSAYDDIGSDTPAQVTTSGTRHVRDPYVRRQVEIRAKGKCELCGENGFLRPDGTSYLETHHIIALSNGGPDRVTNVIAVCANHHREAHFGAKKGNLEQRMALVVAEALRKL